MADALRVLILRLKRVTKHVKSRLYLKVVRGALWTVGQERWTRLFHVTTFTTPLLCHLIATTSAVLGIYLL